MRYCGSKPLLLPLAPPWVAGSSEMLSALGTQLYGPPALAIRSEPTDNL